MTGSLAALVRRANAKLLVEGDADAVGDFFTDDYVAHLTDQDMPGGHAAIRRVVELYRRAFTDLEVEVEVLVEHGDRIAWQRTVRATHTGPFQGFPGTGRPLVWRDMLVSRVEADRIAEEWVLTDLAERLLRAR